MSGKTKPKPSYYMFEHRGEPLLPARAFVRRLVRNGALAGAVLLVSMVVGTAGYRWLGGMGWLDSFYNAALILGGMGPDGSLEGHPAGKVFAAFYSLYCGLAILTSVAVLLAPVYHRFMHSFHLETEEAEEKDSKEDAKQGRKGR